MQLCLWDISPCHPSGGVGWQLQGSWLPVMIIVIIIIIKMLLHFYSALPRVALLVVQLCVIWVILQEGLVFLWGGG